jgi:ankyrin repeat protein
MTTNIKGVKFLNEEYSSSANINSQDKNGFTALHHAVISNNTPMVELLVKSKWDQPIKVEVENTIGLTPADYIENGNLNMKAALKNRCECRSDS